MALLPPSIEYQLARSFRSPAHRAEAWKALLQTQITVPGKPAGDDSVALDFINDEGRPVYPFFTSQYIYWGSVAVRKGFGPENLVMPARSLLEMTRGQSLILNPDGPFGIPLEPDDVDRLLATQTLPPGRGRPRFADNEVMEQIFMEHEAAQATVRPEAAVMLRRHILKTKVLLIVRSDQVVNGKLPEGVKLDAVSLFDERGPVCPIYTSMHMVRATLAAGNNLPNRTLTLNGRTALHMSGAERFVLNPHGPTPFFFDY